MTQPKPLSAAVNEQSLYERICALLVSARRSVARGVDLIQVQTNFEIGRYIDEFELKGADRADYGQTVLQNLATKLSSEFGRGLSKSNLEYMRRFYVAYQNRSPIAQTLSGQSKAKQNAPFSAEIAQTPSGQLGSPQPDGHPFSLSWSHYVFLLGIKNPDERSFYEIEAANQSWTVRELKRQFDTSLYERLALSRDKAGIRKLALEGQIVANPKDLLKEPMVLEFLGLSEQAHYSESDLESALISQIEHFLLELGKGFLFEARQKRFTFDDDHFFVDLVFYNRLLRCYVLIDLKLGKLSHQDLGQMQMYVNYFDRHVKTEAENASIGIVLCKQKHEALVEITLPKDANIHARAYQLYLPSKDELQQKLQEWAGEIRDQ
jgi:predicted nuclease of restriction endonuclease-like (RecB) superfamily